MCMIALKPEGKDIPERQALYNGYMKNNHGLGLAVSDGQHILIKKDFKTFNDMYSWIENNVKREHTLLVHFRFATHGLKDMGNRHPFPITSNIRRLRQLTLTTNMAMAHNGIFHGLEHKKLSDTQMFVRQILSPIRQKVWNNEAIKSLLKDYVGHSKVAIIHQTGEYVLFGEWIEDKGILYSNTDYKTTYISFGNTTHKRECWACGSTKKLKWDMEDADWLCKRCRKMKYAGKAYGDIPEYDGGSTSTCDQLQDDDNYCSFCYDSQNLKYRKDLSGWLCDKCYSDLLFDSRVVCEECGKDYKDGAEWRTDYKRYLCSPCYINKSLRDYDNCKRDKWTQYSESWDNFEDKNNEHYSG